MGSGGRILVVDDDPGVREAMEAALGSAYAVRTVADAAGALEAVCDQRFDLILLDYSLPDLPGTAVLKLVKRFFPSTLVILITGLGSEEVAMQALRGGARDYIRKPIDCRELQARVAALLHLRRNGPERRQNPFLDAIDPSSLPARAEPAAPIGDRGRVILKAIRYIDDHLDAGLTLVALAGAAGLSASHFCRRFKDVTGLHFREYLTRRRIARAKELLRTRGRTITDIVQEVGFKDMTHFGRAFKKLEGLLPSEFRRSVGGDRLGRPSSPDPRTPAT